MPGNGLTITSSRPCPLPPYRPLSGAPLGLFPAPPQFYMPFHPTPPSLLKLPQASSQIPPTFLGSKEGSLVSACLAVKLGEWPCLEWRTLSPHREDRHILGHQDGVSPSVFSLRGSCCPWAAGALWETRAWRRRVLETASCIPFVLYKRTLRHPAPWSGVFQGHLEVTEAWIEKKECFKITCPLDVLLKLSSLRSTSHMYRTPKWMNEKWKMNSEGSLICVRAQQEIEDRFTGVLKRSWLTWDLSQGLAMAGAAEGTGGRDWRKALGFLEPDESWRGDCHQRGLPQKVGAERGSCRGRSYKNRAPTGRR